MAANDTFTVGFSDRTTMTLPKSELVSKLTDLSNNKLTSDARWQLRDKLTDWNFNAFSAFMLDVHAQLAILSKSFQSNSLTVFDIPKNLNRSLRALQKLKDTPGPAEQAFWAEVSKDDNADVLRTCQLFAGEEGRIDFKNNREAILAELDENLTTRYQKVLDDPVIRSMAIFEHKKWPSSAEALKDFGTTELLLLYSTYKTFFESSETESLLLEQWEDMKREIVSGAGGLLTLKFHDLWARMLVHYSDEYPLPLRLVVIVLLLPCDTSECERVFSLMNDTKTAERSSLNQLNLKHLMLWHRLGKHFSCEQLPVVEILKEFRRLAGIRGRNAHRPTQPPAYDFKMKVELDAESSDAPAPAPAPAPVA